MSLVGGPNILSSMAGVMENNLGVGVGTGGSSTGPNSTPSLSPDLPAASSSSDSCPSPMSHNSPPENNMMSFGNGSSNNVISNNQLTQSPQRSHVDKHQSRSHSPTNSTTSSMSSKSSHLPGTPKRHDQFSQQQHDTTITHASVNAAASPNPKSTGNEDSNGGNNDAGNTSSDDYSDEIKVYNEEGAAEEEQRNSDDLKEEKTEIIQKTIEEKPSPSHPFSINNLFGFGAAAAAASKSNTSSSPFGNNPFAAAAAFGALNQQRNSIFNPAALYSQELASHFASWWPAAAAAGANAFNPYSSPAFNPFNPFSAAANYQQQAAAAAVFQAAAASRFSPSLFLPPPPGTNGLSSPKAEPSSHSASSSASSTSSNGSSSSSSSSAFSSTSNNANPNMHPSSPFSSSSGSSSNSARFNNQHHNPSQQHMSSPSANSFNHKSHLSSSTKKKNQSYENNYPMGNGHMGNVKHHPDGQQGHMGSNMGHHHHQGNPLHPNHYIKQESQNHYIKQEGHLAAPVPHVMVKEKPKKPHVKKPLNAFMLFMKEQRAAVVSECTLRESAAINQILGRKWHELERTEQAKYYEKARLARLEHMQQNPGWSARDNYGLKKKRRRKREKVIGENGELPRKCRARYGLHQLHLWCKPCRRKKKCIRFAGNGEDMQNGQMMGPGGQFHMGDGSGSMNGSGGNSDDDYENYEDDSDETETDTDDENDDAGYQQSPKPNKQPHLMNSHSGNGHLPGPPGFHLPPNHPGNLMQNPYQQHQPGQQYQQMHNSFNSHLLKQMSNQMGRSDMDAKAMLQHQLKLNQEPF